MAAVVDSRIPGGFDAEITLTFETGAEITTAVGSTATAKFQHPDTGAVTSATSAVVTSATTVRVKLNASTLTTAKYLVEAYLTPPAGQPQRVWSDDVFIKAILA